MIAMVTGLPEAPQRLSVTITDGHSVVFSWDAVTSAIVSDTSPPPHTSSDYIQCDSPIGYWSLVVMEQ